MWTMLATTPTDPTWRSPTWTRKAQWRIGHGPCTVTAAHTTWTSTDSARSWMASLPISSRALRLRPPIRAIPPSTARLSCPSAVSMNQIQTKMYYITVVIWILRRMLCQNRRLAIRRGTLTFIQLPGDYFLLALLDSRQFVTNTLLGCSIVYI